MSVVSSSSHILVSGATITNPYVNMSAPSAGMMRYNGSSYVMEVYDGCSWIQLASTQIQDVTLSPTATAAIEWATRKMQEEENLKLLCAKFPALQNALNNFEMIKALVENENLSSTV